MRSNPRLWEIPHRGLGPPSCRRRPFRHPLAPIREQSPWPQGSSDSVAPAQHPDVAGGASQGFGQEVAVHQETAQRTLPPHHQGSVPSASASDPRIHVPENLGVGEPETEPDMDSEFFDCIDEDPMTFAHPRLQHASAPCLHAKLVQGHVFTFVRAASLKSSDGPFPRFQDVNEDWLVRKRINIYDLMDPVTRVALSQGCSGRESCLAKHLKIPILMANRPGSFGTSCKSILTSSSSGLIGAVFRRETTRRRRSMHLSMRASRW